MCHTAWLVFKASWFWEEFAQKCRVMAPQGVEPEHLCLHAESTPSPSCHGRQGQKETCQKNSPSRELLSCPWRSQAAPAAPAGREDTEALLAGQAPLCRVEVLLRPDWGLPGRRPLSSS